MQLFATASKSYNKFAIFENQRIWGVVNVAEIRLAYLDVCKIIEDNS